jgi:hypothetical protein
VTEKEQEKREERIAELLFTLPQGDRLEDEDDWEALTEWKQEFLASIRAKDAKGVPLSEREYDKLEEIAEALVHRERGER